MSNSILQVLRQVQQKQSRIIQQKYKYFLIIDFEATCDKKPNFSPKEIIEFPCVVLNSKTFQNENKFHSYIKPRINPELTQFCTELTGISQQTIAEADEFPSVLKAFDTWILKNGYFQNNNTIFVTHGDWDLKVILPKQCALANVPLPEYFQQWIDIRKSYAQLTSQFPKGIKDICSRVKIPHQGRLHCGLDDAENISAIVRKLSLEMVLEKTSDNS